MKRKVDNSVMSWLALLYMPSPPMTYFSYATASKIPKESHTYLRKMRKNKQLRLGTNSKSTLNLVDAHIIQQADQAGPAWHIPKCSSLERTVAHCRNASGEGAALPGGSIEESEKMPHEMPHGTENKGSKYQYVATCDEALMSEMEASQFYLDTRIRQLSDLGVASYSKSCTVTFRKATSSQR